MGGNVAVNYSSYGISEQDWKKLSPKTQEFVNSAPQAAKQVARLLAKGHNIDEINKYFDKLEVTGMSVEKGKGKDEVPDKDLTPEELAAKDKEKLENLRQDALKTTPDMMENKDMRKTNEEQWEQYFLERYKQNPAEARQDIVQVMYQKEVRETKQTLQNMMRDTKAEKMLKSKYLAEGSATEEEKERYDARKAELRKLYMEEPRAKWDAQIKPLQEEFNALEAGDPKRAELKKQIEDLQAKREKACDKAALDAYNSIRPPHQKVQEKDWVQEGEHLSTEQIEAILDLKALDAFDITEGKIEKMAIHAVSESKFNKGVAEVQKMREEIAQLKADNITPEVQRVQNKAIMADREYDEKIAKLLEEAETDESKRLRQEATEANVATRAEVARLRKAGKDIEADALEKKRLEAKEEAQKKIQEALDQDKLEEANKLTEERTKAREAATKEAYDALPQKVRDKIEKLEKKIQKTMDEANTDNNKLLTENLDDIAKIMAKTQIDKQRAENKFNKTVVKFDKLDDDIKEWVQANPEDFAELAKEGETPPLGETFTTKKPVLDDKGRQVYDENGDPKMEEQHWVFKSEKFKNFMLAMSNDNNLDNDEAVDPRNKADFYADMQDRKKVTRDRKGEQAVTKFKDRRFAARAFKAAGIETEGDRTLGMQIGATVKAFGKGFVVGSIGALAAEYLSTTKVVESKFFKLVQYSGSVPWAKMVHYEGETDATLTGRYQKHLEGDVGYHQDIVVEGNATGYVEFGYEGDVGYSGSVGYEGDVGYSGSVGYEGDVGYSGTVSGTAHGNYSGTANGKVPVTHTDYQNGIPIGSYTKDVDVSLPYSGSIDIPYEQGYTGSAHYSGTADYSGTAHYSGTADYSGTAHYSGTVGGEVSIPYKKVVSADGTVHWVADVDDEVTLTGKAHYEGDVLVEGEAEYSGEEKVEGTTKGSPKINLKNVLNIGIGAGIANVLASLPDIVKIKDEGMRKETIRRQVLSDKGVDDRKPVPPTTQVNNGDDNDDGNCGDVNNDCKAGLAMEDGKDDEKTENVKYEPTYFKESRERSEWYDFAAAYDWDPKKVSLKQVYRAIQARNGYSAANPNPPKQMMLPLDLDLGNGVVLKRKDNYTIAKHKIPQHERGNNKGRAAGGKANIIKIPGTPKYYFIDCDGKEHIVNSETEARNKYKDATGKDFDGPIPKK